MDKSHYAPDDPFVALASQIVADDRRRFPSFIPKGAKRPYVDEAARALRSLGPDGQP